MSSLEPAAIGSVEPAPFVDLVSITKRYPGVLAVEDVSIRYAAGQVVGLVGKNGAGKSTLIKIMAGAVRPDKGHLAIDGLPVALHQPRDAIDAGLAFVHQDLHDAANLSVAENVMLGLGFPKKLGGFVDWRGLRRQAHSVMERLEVDIDPRATVGDLSVAKQRMVMIARGIAQQARMVVLDEPTASLTDEEIRHLFGVVRNLQGEGIAVLYVSHRLDEILDLTERVVVMLNGRVVADEPTVTLNRRSLITHITGHQDAETASERRRSRGIGGRPATDVVLEVNGVVAPPSVSSCSFDIRAGEILGIAGLVGAGRTELVRAIFGADRRASGTIKVRGHDVASKGPAAAMAAGMALLPEDRKSQGNVMDFSVRQNITLSSLRRHRVSNHVAVPSAQSERTEATTMIKRLSIKTPHDRQQVRLLSGGNQQKVVIAKWLSHGADILFFDEPTHGVDVDGKEEIYNIIGELAAAGKSVVFISSEFSELVGVCHRALVMQEGAIVGSLDGDEINEQAIVALCYSGRSA